MTVIADLPDIRPSLLLDFANSGRVDPRIQCVRASTATCFGRDGKLRTVAAHVPRIDYEPVTGKCLGLLVEEPRTNLALYSESIRIMSGAWSASRCTLEVAPGVPAPVGLSGVSKITPDGSGSPYVSCLTAAVPANSALSTTVFLKSAGAVTVQIDFIASTGFTNIRGTLNLLTGVFAIGSVGGARARPLPDGWYEVSVFGSFPDAAITNIRIGVNDAGATSANAVYVTGAQVELGAFPTSYIPTTTAAVTRAADLMTTNVTLPNVGAILASVVGEPSANASNTYVWSAISPTDPNADHAYLHFNGATKTTNWWVKKGQVDQSGGNIAGFRLTSGFSFDAVTKAAVIASGSLITQDASVKPCDFPSNLTQLLLGRSRANTGYLNGCLSRLAIYSGRITNAQLQRLSA